MIRDGIRDWVMGKVQTVRLREKIRREHMAEVRMIERNYWLYKTRPKKLNIKKLREIVNAGTQGWKERRILGHVKGLASVQDVIELVKLSGDLQRDKGVNG